MRIHWNLFHRTKAPKNEIALVTANFGGIDAVRSLPAREGIDGFYYTDQLNADNASREAISTWSRVIVPNYPRHDFNPRLQSRYFKHQIHRLDEVQGHRWLAWADSSLQFKDLRFLVDSAAALARLPSRKRVLLVPHPDRATVNEEFEFIEGAIRGGDTYLTLRYAREKMPEQMNYFRQRGWNVHAKLWCGGIWMMENTPPFWQAWDAWWDQNLRFGMMDQLSLPVILETHGLEPQALAVHLWQNEHFEHVLHQKEI